MSGESEPIDVHARVRANLFPGALPHIASWKPGLLEPRQHVLWGSQALCVSIWGSIAENEKRGAIIRDILAAAGIELRLNAQPAIKCEVRGRRDVLNEYGGSNPTCPDALITGGEAVLAVESKFTEHLGGCSQVKPKTVTTQKGKVKHPPPCSGNHEIGSDLKTLTDAPCRLTVQDGERTVRRYWEVGTRLFRPDVLATPRRPCPFRNGSYQLMRNYCFATALAELEGHATSGFLLAYVAAARAARQTEELFGEFKAMLLPDAARHAGAITYEQIAEIVRDHGDTALADWIDTRLPTAIHAQTRGRHRARAH